MCISAQCTCVTAWVLKSYHPNILVHITHYQGSVVDPERFDADPDPDPTFQADVDPDPNSFIRVRNFFLQIFIYLLRIKKKIDVEDLVTHSLIKNVCKYIKNIKNSQDMHLPCIFFLVSPGQVFSGNLYRFLPPSRDFKLHCGMFNLILKLNS